MNACDTEYFSGVFRVLVDRRFDIMSDCRINDILELFEGQNHQSAIHKIHYPFTSFHSLQIEPSFSMSSLNVYSEII
jgi:hypothetical protein